MEIGTATSGTNGFDAMRAALGSQNADERDSRLASRIMSSKDTDKSGGLSASELGVSQSNLTEFDTDGDGVVSQAELEAGLKARREKMQAQMQNQMMQNGQLGMLQASIGQGLDKQDAKMAQSIFAQKDADKSGGLSASELGVSAEQLKKVDTNGDGQVSQEELTAALKASRESQGTGKAHHHHHHKAAGSGQDGQNGQDGNSQAQGLNNLISGLFGGASSTTGAAGATSGDASQNSNLADFMLRQKASSAYQNMDKIIANLFANSGQAAQPVSVSA